MMVKAAAELFLTCIYSTGVYRIMMKEGLIFWNLFKDTATAILSAHSGVLLRRKIKILPNGLALALNGL